MKLFYNFIGNVYSFLIKCAIFFSPKAKMMQKGRWRLWKKLKSELDTQGGYIWIHVSSLGEFEQGRPLIERIKRDYPSEKIMLTFFSPSGYEVRKSYELADVISYLPADTILNAKKFLNMVKPKMAIFIKYDFWPCFLLELKDRQIPTYLVSAIFRPSQLFFRWYGKMYRYLLTCFDKLYVQNDASKELLAKYKITNVDVVGDTRLDRVIKISQNGKELPMFDKWVESSNTPIIVAGSTWPPDEKILLNYFNKHPNVRLILAPHEFDDERILKLTSFVKRPFIRFSDANSKSILKKDCIIVDSFGLLSSLYRYATFAYVGGGFGKGIHNTPEAAVYGIPVFFGPEHHKFKEALGLLESGGGICIHDQEEFDRYVDDMLMHKYKLESAGKASHDYIYANAGAADKVINDIFKK
ncbi:3-deoxy-D-manno-octulosonic acid transferase [Falsiporphyromonas endometrii]|uniref:3-deoxy-D-manno-octulosonic acid transferase n=1 Tax=Falsiporphyromonas endometrii TaxID=1387297 RepID=A0ABV9K9N0_9PORP|nr:glycosyltransferase N-terminal domain-containing protein [Porphyromonadaceae bacterium]